MSNIRRRRPNLRAVVFFLHLLLPLRVTERVIVTLDVRNLLDRENDLPSIQSNPSTGGIPDEERTFKLGVTYPL
jgi:hypothetical protein